MKKLIIVLCVGAVIATAYVAFFNSGSSLQNAILAEKKSDYEQARAQYIEALLEMTKLKEFPNKNRAKIVSQNAWYREIREFMQWINAPEIDRSPAIANILDGLGRCSAQVKQEIIATKDSSATYTQQSFSADWNRAFFPSGVTVQSNQNPLIKQTYIANGSFLRFSALTSFMYSANLIDMRTWRRVHFDVYPEDEVTVPVRKGNYLLICSSKVTFPNGQIWRSSQNVVSLQVVDSLSFTKVMLKTRAHR